jgi:hypothetical protein
VWQELAPPAGREVADPEDGSRPGSRNLRSSARDRLGETGQGVVPVVLAKPPVALSLGGKLGCGRQDPPVRQANRAPELGGERRWRASTAHAEKGEGDDPKARFHGGGSTSREDIT